MNLEKIYTHYFSSPNEAYAIALGKDYIITNYNYEGVHIFNKEGKILKKIILNRELIIDRIFTHFTYNVIALYCPLNQEIILLDIESEIATAIPIPSHIELDENELLPFYYWEENLLIVQRYDGTLIKINTHTTEITIVALKDLKTLSKNFYHCLKQSEAYVDNREIVDAQSNHYQVVYFNPKENEIGILEGKNNKQYTVEYLNNDIHNAFFDGKNIIVIGCYAIDIVNKDGIVQSLSCIKHRKLLHGIFIPPSEIIVIEEFLGSEAGAALAKISLQI